MSKVYCTGFTNRIKKKKEMISNYCTVWIHTLLGELTKNSKSEGTRKSVRQRLDDRPLEITAGSHGEARGH